MVVRRWTWTVLSVCIVYLTTIIKIIFCWPRNSKDKICQILCSIRFTKSKQKKKQNQQQ